MINSKVYTIDDFYESVNSPIAFITCASFEERTFTVPRVLNKDLISKAYVFTTNATEKINDNSNKLKEVLGYNARVVEVTKNDPFSYNKNIGEVFTEICNEKISLVYVDITTFNHEMLLILLGIIKKKHERSFQIKFLYNGAKEYSVGDTIENKWLSKGCREVRSILGYPGILIPQKQTCLIVLVGFEHERASALIDAMEPDKVLIGHGRVDSLNVVAEEHIEPMRYFQNIHNRMFASGINNIETFDFYVKDIEMTRKILIDKIEQTADYNHIIVPLNTKTSTIAAGLVALENADIQICYAEPEIYNDKNYSIPGDKIFCYDIN